MNWFGLGEFGVGVGWRMSISTESNLHAIPPHANKNDIDELGGKFKAVASMGSQGRQFIDGKTELEL
jgi:hypothetical protein